MPIIDKLWTLTSTGAGVRVDGAEVREWTFHFETAAGSTCTAQLRVARTTDTSAAGVPFGSAVNLGASSGATLQFTGPLAAVWPHVSDLTSTGTLYVRGVGN